MQRGDSRAGDEVLGEETESPCWSPGHVEQDQHLQVEWEEALHLLAVMLQCKLEADTIVFTTLISACAKAAEWQTALQLFAEMMHCEVQDSR